MAKKALKVLYIFAGERKKQEKLWRSGEHPDTCFLGLNHLKNFGVEAEYLENKTINYIRRKNFNLANLFYLFKLKNYEVVFLGGSLSLVFLAKVIFKFSKPKFVFFNTYFTNLLNRNRQGLKAGIIRRAIGSLDAIICPSEAQRNFLIKEGFDENKIFFIPTGVDVDFIGSYPAPKTSKDFVLSVGKDMGRDYKTLIEAVKNTAVNLKIVALARNLTDLILPANVSCQSLPFLELLPLYKNCQFVVIPTKKQGNFNGSDCSGHLALLDAMASGKAIIASERETLADYITDGVHGLIVEPENSEALKKAILKLLENHELAAEMGRRSREKAERLLSTKDFAENLAKIFKKIAE